MRTNLPVTQREFEVGDGVTLMSTTDPQSHLTYANAAFIEVSGFSRDELMGQPHNVVRHPDMPREAFADMWATLKAGQSWTALVKNRRKNGDHYWVRANATPVLRAGRCVGYMSVRTKPARAEIAAAEGLYRAFCDGKAGGRAFHKGLVVRTGWARWMSLGQLLPVRWRLRLATLVAAGVSLGAMGWNAGAAGWPAMAVAGAAAMLCHAWLERQFVKPLESLLVHAQSVAAGQATEVPPLNRVDEIGLLSRAVNQAGLNLKALLDDVSLQVDGVSIASAEIAQGNNDLSARTEESAASLQQTAASMAQLSSTVSSNADRARSAEALAREADVAANKGNEVVASVGETMNAIQGGSRKIAEIISLIDGIAFQTNILALNAAVEATRAGEQGRGFAVVAGEVRSLAQRSASAAKDIKTLIEGSVDSVESGSRLVGQASVAMQDIVGRVRQVNEHLGEIASATAEQSSGLNQVDVAVGQLDKSTQQNAALVEESAAAAESLRQQAARLADAVGAFRDRAPS